MPELCESFPDPREFFEPEWFDWSLGKFSTTRKLGWVSYSLGTGDQSCMIIIGKPREIVHDQRFDSGVYAYLLADLEGNEAHVDFVYVKSKYRGMGYCRVLYDILATYYDIVKSGRQQTKEGMRIWKSMLRNKRPVFFNPEGSKLMLECRLNEEAIEYTHGGKWHDAYAEEAHRGVLVTTKI